MYLALEKPACLHFNKFCVCIFYRVAQLCVEAVVASILHLTVLPKVDFFSLQVTLFTFLQDRDTVLFNMGSAMINGILQWILSLRSTSDILISLSSMKITVGTHNCNHYCVDTSTKIMLKLQEKKGKIKRKESAIFIIFPSNLVCLQMQLSLQMEIQ